MFRFEIFLLLSMPALLAIWIFSCAVRRRHQETVAILTALTQSVQALRRELRMLRPEAIAGPPMPETAEAEPPTLEGEESREEPAGALEAEPPGPAAESLEAELVSPSPESDSQAESTPTIPAPARKAPTSVDTAAGDMLTRIGNWLLFGQETAPTGTAAEVAIATNWLLRIGMLILVLGIAFFLKYSIDRGWIGPWPRVLLGTATGLAMVSAGSLLLGGRYRLLGHGLQGGGIVTLYLSVYAAAIFLHLIPVESGFAGMACVTALAWFLALVFGSPLTAVIGIAGGYLTPVLLWTGATELVPLYTYLAILGVGVLGISLRRNWPQLNILSFLGTYLWLWSLKDRSESFFTSYWTVLFFLTLFFVLFSTIVFLSSRLRSRANLFDVGMLWVNALFFFGLARSITQAWLLTFPPRELRWLAAIPLGIALFYSAHAYFLLLRRSRDVVLFQASVGLASVFLAIAVPLSLSGDWITFAWAAQSLVMLWLALRIDSRFLRWAAWVLFAITAVRFFGFDILRRISGPEPLWQGHLAEDVKLFLPRLAGFGGSVLCVALAARLLFRRISRADRQSATAEVKIWEAARVLAVTAAAMLFVYVTLEIHDGVQAYYLGMERGAVSIWWALFAIALIAVGMRSSQRWLRTGGLLLFVVVTCKVFFYDLGALETVYRIIAFVILGLVILSGSVLYLRYKTTAADDDAGDGESRP